MLLASFEKIILKFKHPAGTSRGILRTKKSWIIRIWKDTDPSTIGIGEASIIESLSPEWSALYEQKVEAVVNNIDLVKLEELKSYPSIRFGVESALLDLQRGGTQSYYDSSFSKGLEGIKINGLIWMGDRDYMLKQIKGKLKLGFSCIKLKIGAIDFQYELDLLHYVRSEFSSDILELRVDANGAFSPETALSKLQRLSKFELHSIEQPIKPGQWDSMYRLCQKTPLPIALDEELIGIDDYSGKREMLEAIMPQYVILKPSLLGGFEPSDEWISLAESLKLGWWITSALESNIGLDAIAQYTASKKNSMPQGLGTGQLFTNNSNSTLRIKGERLFHH